MIFQDAYFEVWAHPVRRGVLWLARTEQPFASIPEARASYERLGRALDGQPCATLGAVLDLRRARGRHEPEFEHFAAHSSGLILRRFRAAAILVKSMVGRLQVHRIEKELGAAEPAVFTDEAEALAYLTA